MKNSQKMLQPATIPVMTVNSLMWSGGLQVADYVGVHNVHVVRDLTQQYLLGTDFLEKCRCVMNMDNKTLAMADHRQPVQLVCWGM